MGVSNLECFLTRATPAVPSRSFLKNLRTGGQFTTRSTIKYFNLGDLWDSFDEWSAYGLGSPIVLSQQEMVVQHYTPLLSAIQIYTVKPESSCDSCNDWEAELEMKSWSSDGEGLKLSRSSSSNSDKTWDVEDIGYGLDNSWSLERDQPGELYFQHFELDSPYGRAPLKEKVDELSQKYWGLRSLNSIDLSPASWFAIAWYPIYPIPSSRIANKLYAAFLTYHNLSLIQESVGDNAEGPTSSLEVEEERGKKELAHVDIHLHPFGLATYRMQPKIWLDNESSDHGRISSLRAAAGSWLKQCQVQHHDYNFFISRSP